MIIKGRCETCGCGKWYPHRMDYSKTNILQQIKEINKLYEWVKIQQDHILIKDKEKEYTIQTDAVHATRLYWFGLVDKKPGRSGYVKINQEGIEFLRGKHKVPYKIWVSKGRVMEKETYLVSINEIKDVILDKEYWDNYPKNEEQK